MNIVKKLSLASSLLAVMTVPALAGVTVNSPANGGTVGTSFNLSAFATNCSSQNTSAMAYSLDNGGDIAIINGGSVNASVSSGTGWHTLHVKAWGNQGALCLTDVSVNVTSTSSSAAPSDSATVSNLQNQGNWKATKDAGTPGSASGSMSITNSPSRTGNARSFYTAYNNYGGMRYSVSFGDDTQATHFLYDGWIYIKDYAKNIANLEMDMNQVMPNGQTVIFGFQCDGWSGTWDYTANKGTPSKPSDQWIHSSQHCNPQQWSVNTWHHVQISYSRDGSGYVTYHYVTLDGNQQNINATVLSAFSLGWAPTMVANFQVDGSQSGSASSLVYLDGLQISRW